MKSSVEIIAFVKSDASIKELLKEFSHVKYVEDCKSLMDITKNLNYMKSHLLDDLKAWKEYIFIEPNTQDIHYMDDSFVENCATIITFINSKEKEANDADDDLEFF